jgi:hypothetical protein
MIARTAQTGMAYWLACCTGDACQAGVALQRRPRFALACLVVLGALAFAGCGGEPATWTVEGESVDGVRPRMTLAQVHERWEEVASFNPNESASGASLGLSAACVDERPVLTGFWSWSGDDRDAELFFAWLFDRIRTEEGIRIGSTLDELRAQYGARLERVAEDEDDGLGESPLFSVFKVIPPRARRRETCSCSRSFRTRWRRLVCRGAV